MNDSEFFLVQLFVLAAFDIVFARTYPFEFATLLAFNDFVGVGICHVGIGLKEVGVKVQCFLEAFTSSSIVLFHVEIDTSLHVPSRLVVGILRNKFVGHGFCLSHIFFGHVGVQQVLHENGVATLERSFLEGVLVSNTIALFLKTIHLDDVHIALVFVTFQAHIGIFDGLTPILIGVMDACEVLSGLHVHLLVGLVDGIALSVVEDGVLGQLHELLEVLHRLIGISHQALEISSVEIIVDEHHHVLAVGLHGRFRSVIF